ncbi:hypothetical protein CHS0354_009055 [Potamilus streckersoni]|uniref:G-protein coupled receptors family 1 profile domain-containing protein n=1 Tax=Potamilus streckersoni TaxID=2493646 RepID=A0AAE0THT6_9BIVA|nr:hypothetical protein CHS0354_009055 [Potamilus streckersoni]
MATGNESTTTVESRTSHMLLEQLNDKKTALYIPIFVFLLGVMIVGLVGNCLVLYVYSKKFRRTSSNYFILTMAVFDLLACVIGLPTEIYDVTHTYTFSNSVLCKVLRYTESVTVYGSVILLLEIGIDRYFKICRPLMMMEIRTIKILCILAGVVALLIAIPAVILFGISETETHMDGITGADCSIEERYRKGTFSKVYYFILCGVFIFSVILLTSIYIRIWIEIRKRKSMVIGDYIAKRGCKFEMNSDPIHPVVPNKRDTVLSSESDDDSAGNKMINEKGATKRPKLESIAEAVHRFRVNKTTVMLFIVTVVFVVSYMPVIVIMAIRSIIKDIEKRQTDAEDVIGKLFSKFYFLNNATNPIIYSFLNVTFRRHSFKLLKQLFSCKIGFNARSGLKTSSLKSNRSSRSNKDVDAV